MRTSPPIAPHAPPHQDTYLVLDDFGRIGRAWRETAEEATDRETVIRKLLAGEYNNPVSSELTATVSRDPLAGFGGQPYLLDVYRVVLDVPGLGSFLLDLPAHSGETYILLGRDVLNRYRVTFDGPNGVVEFH